MMATFLKEQLSNQRKVRPEAKDDKVQVPKNELERASPARAENISGKTLEKWLAEVKLRREKDRRLQRKMASEFALVELMREKELEMASLVRAANDRERALHKELTKVKHLREKDRDAFKQKELKMAYQVRAANDREKAIARQLAEVMQLRVKDRDAFSKEELNMTTDLVKCDDEKVKKRQSQMDSLKEKLSSETSSSLDSLDKIAELREFHSQEIERQNFKIHKLSTELEKSKEELKTSEDLKASLMKEAVEMKEKMFAKDAEIESLKDKTATLRELQDKWELEKKTLLNSLHTTEAVKQNLQSRLEALQDKNHAPIQKMDGLEQTAEQNKTTHENASGEFLSERTMLLRNAQESHTFITKPIQKHEREKSSFLDKTAQLEDVHNQEMEMQGREKRELATKLEQIQEELKTSKESNMSLMEKLAKGKKEIIFKEAEVKGLREEATTMSEQIKVLLNKLHGEAAEKQNVSKQLLDLGEEFSALQEKMVRQMEQKAEMDKDVEKLQTQIQNIEKNAALESQHWFDEKNGLLEEFQSKLEASEEEKQALIKKEEKVVEAAKMERRSFLIFLTEAREVEQELKMKLTKKEDEVQNLIDTICALEKQLVKKYRKQKKWYKRLLH